MSGGSLQYFYSKIEWVIPYIPDKELRALMADLKDVLHDCEWYLDDDICEETWQNTLQAFKKKWFDTPREERLKEIIEKSFKETKEEMLKMVGIQEPDNE